MEKTRVNVNVVCKVYRCNGVTLFIQNLSPHLPFWHEGISKGAIVGGFHQVWRDLQRFEAFSLCALILQSPNGIRPLLSGSDSCPSCLPFPRDLSARQCRTWRLLEPQKYIPKSWRMACSDRSLRKCDDNMENLVGYGKCPGWRGA